MLIGNVEKGDELYADVQLRYGDLGATLTTLIAAISGGLPWLEAVKPLYILRGSARVACVMVLLSYIQFVMFGLANVWTGIFVEATKEVWKIDAQQVATAEFESEDSSINKFKCKFQEETTQEDNNLLSFDDLSQIILEEETREYLHDMEVSQKDAITIFHLLDVKNHHILNIKTYIKALQGFAGDPSSALIMTLAWDGKKSQERWNAYVAYAREQFTVIKRALDDMSPADDGDDAELDANSPPQPVLIAEAFPALTKAVPE